MALNNYLQQTQILLSDLSETNYNRFDLVNYINEGRQQIAAEGQCVRYVPVQGAVASVLLSTAYSAGSGSGGTPGTYALTFTPVLPDTVGSVTAATGTYTVGSNGSVTSVSLLTSGANYTQAPTVAFGGAGFSAPGAVPPTAIAVMVTGIPCVINQEVYPFSYANGFINAATGVGSIIAVRGISMIWNTYRFTVSRTSFSKYQALVRTYTDTFTDVPRVGAQYGQGKNGSMYLYPLPNSNYIMEWDCICDVLPLTDDSTVEAIPDPWATAVQYYAAFKALQSAQDFDRADKMFEQFEKFMKRARSFSQPGMVVNWYGRG